MDWSVFAWVRDTLWNPVLDVIMKYITLLGEGGIIWIIFALILVCTKKYRKCGLMMGAALLLMLVINDGILKNLFARPRPFDLFDPANPGAYAVWKEFPFPNIVSEPTSFSFPSGHTSSSFAAALPMLKADKKIGIPAMILAFLIGFSRIYVHVHYLTDVLVGAIAGLFYGWIGIVLVQRLEPVLKRWWAQRKAAKSVSQ